MAHNNPGKWKTAARVLLAPVALFLLFISFLVRCIANVIFKVYEDY